MLTNQGELVKPTWYNQDDSSFPVLLLIAESSLV